ncbi:MAG: acyl-CoA dehydrogenase family protein [Acidimicrobiales bacterium]|nr:acyl-CoA dehydrogenase family protein [Acidimicrobiales bacterium]
MTDDELRERVRALVADCNPAEVDMVAFRGEQFDRGLARVNFPEGKGGLGLSPKAQTVVDAELRAAPKYYHDLVVNPIGIGMAMPTVLTWGSDELQDRLLRPCFTGEEVWCQLFSEPGAGSDVAGLATRAVEDGDEWVVSGQKVWTTLAHKSRWGMLVARSDPDQPKHKGMTYFVLDLQAAGVEVRPLYQITGEAEFNEVFLTDVRIPDSHRLGARGEGWAVATTTLMNERVALGGGVPARGSGPIAMLVDVWRRERDRLAPVEQQVQRDRVAQLWMRAEAQRLTNWRARDLASSGTPGPEGSVGKLLSAELNKEIHEAVVDLLGPAGMLHLPGYPMVRSEGAAVVGTQPTSAFLRSRANSIEGGTSEVMRNILGERVLGLPGDVRVDKDVPWVDVPRN